MSIATDEACETLLFDIEGRDASSFPMRYKFAIEGEMTKTGILREEFIHRHDCDPIGHVASQVESPRGVIDKAHRIGCPPAPEAMAPRIPDIAGVRVACRFESDVYATCWLLVSRADVSVVEVGDYVAR